MRLLIIVCIATAASLAVACANDETDEGDGGAGDAPAGATEDPNATTVGPELLDQPPPAQARGNGFVSPVDGVAEVAISGLEFVPNTVELTLGEPVTIRATNNDTVAHNLRIAGLDGAFGTEDDAVSDPATIAVGATGELTFAPPVAGEYTFQCDFHPTTMGGVIVVE